MSSLATTISSDDRSVLLEPPVARTVGSNETRRPLRSVEVSELDARIAVQSPGVYSEWMRLFLDDANAHISQHPAQVLSECLLQQTKDPRPAYLLRCYDQSELTLVAALIPKTVRLNRVIGCGLGRTLTGYRLAGSGVVGTGDGQLLNLLTETAASVVRASDAAFLMAEDLDTKSQLFGAFNDLAEQKWLP